MLGQRRLPPQVLFLLSLLLGLLAGVSAYRYASAENWLPAALWGVVALWLVVDAVRALGWMRSGRGPAPEAAQPARPTPQPGPASSAPVNLDPAVTGAQVNPLLRQGSASQQATGPASTPITPAPQSTDQLD